MQGKFVAVNTCTWRKILSQQPNLPLKDTEKNKKKEDKRIRDIKEN